METKIRFALRLPIQRKATLVGTVSRKANDGKTKAGRFRGCWHSEAYTKMPSKRLLLPVFVAVVPAVQKIL